MHAVAGAITEELVGEHGAIIGAINGLVNELGRQAVAKQKQDNEIRKKYEIKSAFGEG